MRRLWTALLRRRAERADARPVGYRVVNIRQSQVVWYSHSEREARQVAAAINERMGRLQVRVEEVKHGEQYQEG